mgnify:CR=1 FL=1
MDLHIYDFDDTLVDSKCLAYVRDSTGEIVHKLDAKNFKEYRLKDGEYYDFKEFHVYPSRGVLIGQTIKAFKMSLSQPNVRTCIITARAKKSPVYDFLSDRGIFCLEIYAINDSTSTGKSNLVRQILMRNYYSNVVLYEDNEENLSTIRTTVRLFDEVKFKGYHVKKDCNILVTQFKCRK